MECLNAICLLLEYLMYHHIELHFLFYNLDLNVSLKNQQKTKTNLFHLLFQMIFEHRQGRGV